MRHHGRRRHRFPRRMFWRVYIYGLILLAAVAMGIGLANKLLPGVQTPWSNYRQIAGYIDEELTPLLHDRPALEAKLERVHRGFGIDLAVYASDGALMGAAGSTPQPLAEPPAQARWLSRWEGRSGAAIPQEMSLIGEVHGAPHASQAGAPHPLHHGVPRAEEHHDLVPRFLQPQPQSLRGDLRPPHERGHARQADLQPPRRRRPSLGG